MQDVEDVHIILSGVIAFWVFAAVTVSSSFLLTKLFIYFFLAIPDTLQIIFHITLLIFSPQLGDQIMTVNEMNMAKIPYPEVCGLMRNFLCVMRYRVKGDQRMTKWFHKEQWQFFKMISLQSRIPVKLYGLWTCRRRNFPFRWWPMLTTERWA